MSGYLMMADGRTIVVRGELVIGRVAGCDVVLADTKASRRHARLIVEAGVVEIEDLGSSNGTLLNGKPVTRRVLRPGDEVQIGSHVLVYREGALPTSPAPAAPAAPASAGSDELFGDDDELFGGTAAAAPSAPRVEPAAAPPPSPPPPAPSAPPPVQAPPAAAPARVVEFADEIVEVKKRPAPAEKKGPAPAAAAEMVQQPRILQFQKKEARGGLLGDDLGQMGGGMKVLVYVGVLALGVGVAYGLITLMR